MTYHKNFIKVKSFAQEDFNELGSRIDAFSISVQKKPIDPIAMKLILDLIKDKFQDFGLNEVTEAFKMAFAKEFEIDKTYGSLTIEWIGSILVSYRKFRNKQIALHEKEKEAKKAEEEQVVSTDQEYYESLVDWIGKGNKVPDTWTYDAVYRHMWVLGIMINTPDVMDELQMFAENVRGELEEEKEVERDKKQHELLTGLLKGEKFKKECRRRYCINYFKNNKQ